ncbi:MAG: DNA recombination protein RmuC, partial [Acidimicrobiales bacterium]
MEIALVIAAVTVASLIGFSAALLSSRRRDARVNTVLEQVMAVAGDSFDARLRTGTAELEHRSRTFDERVDGIQRGIDERLGSVVTALEGRVAEVDKLVTEKVGGVARVVGESVGGMSRSLGNQVTSMGTELEQLRGLVAQLQKERAQQHGQLVEGLEAAARQQRLLADTTQQLRQALANPQARGQWGERMAEDVLRAAGMREGINYRKQRAIEEGTKPDYTFILPDDRVLHMDVKFPVVNYLRHLEAETDAEAVVLRTRFLKDVRDRIKEVTDRGYAAGDSTVGYLLLFIPNESVFGFIHENDPELLDDALRMHVVMCSPTTLFAVLAVVRQAIDTFSVERASEEILDLLARFGDQWRRFSTQIEKV